MGLDSKEFECFEQQFIELVSEFQALSPFRASSSLIYNTQFLLKNVHKILNALKVLLEAEAIIGAVSEAKIESFIIDALQISSSQLREELRSEAARAEAAEAVRDATVRKISEVQAGASAASAALTQALSSLAAVQDELTTVKMRLEFANRQRSIFEEKCTEMMNKTILLERELQNLRPYEAALSTTQRQFVELEERIHKATEDAQSEKSRLENEMKKLEKSASAGTELRERARLAAAAHARERRLATAELQHTARELQTAKAEITRQGILIAELEYRLSKSQEATKRIVDPEGEALVEVKAALEAERVGIERLEKALAAALADNANLAAELHKNDNNELKEPSPQYSTSTNICPIDSFLAE